ncbi:YqaA family protein [Acinetobacter gerneri]|jgi:membrane protein YqaA with SNARE-associated domain|uniref:YqaA family protein n=1 Tax=Acinetobacter gerneri TaxID=202952 RepID=A0AAW8JF50_9GAMM|nr:YqaA family protein [Acinetobacter gerneri]MCH4243076.1 DedA family protein [Acinetobacter gerneri]MDQ9009348.1 YqaA family protein [Acinetobacter gerneri]MDQ9013450.1 YqaA family protein [Acinetobacter gerneri]MDQ9024732.1 YqaA family protein [Acinetobacter gerneri]MDQ9052122.1 YqaA family protein [Acinetobacter gerneri]
MAYFFLFISAFGAATLLPLQSEAVLIALLVQAKHSALILIVVATIGNVLGSCVNWYLGLKIEQFKDKKWFPVSAEKMQKAENIYQKYGFWSLFLSWTPVIGDPITLIAGLMKENFWRFLFIVTLAKAGRYIVLYLIYLGVI